MPDMVALVTGSPVLLSALQEPPEPEPIPLQTQLWGLAILLGACLVVLVLMRMVLLPLLRRTIKKSRFEWDDALVDAKCFGWIAYIAPALVILAATSVLQLVSRMGLLPEIQAEQLPLMAPLQNLARAIIALSIMMAIGAILSAVNRIYSQRASSQSRPIKGYVQIAKIFVYVVGTVSTAALLFGREPWSFIAGIGAFTAILLLVFKDTILSLVASIQLTSNDMLRVGDWIEVPSAGADGDVVDVALHTVKVQNWDKTITTVPTQNLINGSFKNWRAMPQSGGRRIKRSINIDMSTIHFLDQDDIDRFGKFDLLKDYMAEKRKELAESNKGKDEDSEILANARLLTNVGTFRAYVKAYLDKNPKVRKDMTFLVRQLQPTPQGLPLEIYIFSAETGWVDYEGIQADIFDHLLAILPEFGLVVFQQPTGTDISELVFAVSGNGDPE